MAGIPLTVERPPAPPPSLGRLLLNGILSENPVFRLALSLCPAVAVTTTVWNGIILGVAVLLGWLLARAIVAPPAQRPTAARVATSAGRA